MHSFAYDFVATAFDSIPLEVWKEILFLGNKEVGDCHFYSDSELVGEDAKWLQNLGRLRKRRLHFMSSLALNQQTTFLPLLFKDKHDENYNLFLSLEDIKRLLCIMHLCLDNLDSRLAQVESFFVSDSTPRDLTNPSTKNVQIPTLIFSNND